MKKKYSYQFRLLHFFSFICIMIIFSQCKDQLDENALAEPMTSASEIKAASGRLSFRNSASFNQTISELNVLNNDDLDKWIKKFSFSSVLESVDTANADTLSYRRFPSSYQAVLNTDGEVVIGDTIIWYARNGVIHFAPNMNEERLAEIKQGLIENGLTDTYSISRVMPSKEDGRITFSGTVDARWQHEFCWKNNCGSKRKYVHELYNFRNGSQYTLYLRIKLEWYGSKSHDWKPAGEYRYTTWDFSYTAGLYGGRDTDFYGYFYGAQSGNDWRNQDRPVFIASDYLAYSTSTYWDIDVRGSVYQEIQDDPYNGWSSVGYPLW